MDGLREEVARIDVPAEGPLTPEQGVVAFRQALEASQPWYASLLEVVARWVAPDEVVDGVPYRYLIAGEAFDWLRLAQRLVDSARDQIPGDEAEQLLLHGLPPDGRSEEEFEEAIGPQKHRAHLNFQYGVVIEELLLLAVETELQKAGRIAAVGMAVPEVAAYEHVYGKTFDELLVFYRAETEAGLGSLVSQSEMQQFTYWCSKYRLRTGEPARVASDTRKALALMSRLERGRERLGRGSAPRRRSIPR